jgi:hypothetical protein
MSRPTHFERANITQLKLGQARFRAQIFPTLSGA